MNKGLAVIIVEAMDKLEKNQSESPPDGYSEEVLRTPDHVGEAEAMERLAGEERGRTQAEARQYAEMEALAVARRRIELEAAALEQARVRLKTEAAARSLALERAAAEREAEVVAKQRVDAETLALAEAQRREQAALDLQEATARRAQKEAEAEALVKARVESEKTTLESTAARIREEAAREAMVLARTAAEREEIRLAEQRAAQEAALAQARAERILAERAAAVHGQAADGQVPAREPDAPGDCDGRAIVPPAPVAGNRIVAPARYGSRFAVLLVLAAAAGTGYWFGRTAPPATMVDGKLADDKYKAGKIEPEMALRLDWGLATDTGRPAQRKLRKAAGAE